VSNSTPKGTAKLKKKFIKKEVLRKLELAFKDYKVAAGKKKLHKSLKKAGEIISAVALKKKKKLSPKEKE
jgi:hypothetical protein